MIWTNRQKQSAVVLAIFLAGIIYMSQKSDPGSPDVIIKTALREMVSGAESKDLDAFKLHLSDDFRDESGRSKTDVLNVIRAIFLRHPSISLNVMTLDVQESSNPLIYEAQLVLLMSESTLPTDKGEFFLSFREEQGQWRLWSARWGDVYGY